MNLNYSAAIFMIFAVGALCLTAIEIATIVHAAYDPCECPKEVTP